MQLLDDYFKLQKQIYDYFGYKEDWVVIPLDDCTEMYWCLDNDISPNEVRFAKTDEDDLWDEKKGEYYCNSIYTQRFLDKYVYRTDDYTMVCADTLQVFDNTKERKEGEFLNKEDVEI